MTNERAIELLHRISDSQFDGPHGDERREALEMAVRALEGDGDMISRQEVMKEFSDFVRKSNNSDFAQTPTWNDAVSLVGSMPSAQPERPEQPESAKEYCAECNHIEMCRWYPYEGCEFRSLPSAQPERDIPVKPIETTDKAWGIPKRQAVCPKCDYYLGHVAFLGDYKGKRVTYCETCGQAIDWEGWNFDE